MRSLRILHVTPYWADAWAYGGIPRVVGAQARALAALGHRVVVCATDVRDREGRLPAPTAGDRFRPWPAERRDDVELRIFPNRTNRLAYDWQWYTPIGLDHYLRHHARQFDVAHLHGCRNWPGVVAARHLTRHGVPYVLGPNGTAPILERRHFAKRVFDLAAGRSILRQAAAVLAVSEAERVQLVSLAVTSDRIHYVPNPIDAGEHVPPIPRGRFRTGAELDGRPLVAFLGKVTPRKRVDLLVRAFSQLGPDVQLVVAGSDMGGLDEARALAASLGVLSRTSFPGVLTGRDRLQLLADADVFVYPSEHEIFGLAPLEAIVAGTPVVVSDDSGCGEVVRATGGGLVVPVHESGALVSAIERVLASPREWRAAARHAASVVRREFGCDTIAAKLEAVYRQAIGTDVAAELGVTFIVPVRNGAETLPAAIASIETELGQRPGEVLVVEDGSEDSSAVWLRAQEASGRLRVVDGPRRGMSAALNVGARGARYGVICQVDQDVELVPGWLGHVLSLFERNKALAAVEGHYALDRSAPLLARVMALDLDQRYEGAAERTVTHVCTGNTAYRTEALAAVGGFDEALGYGADADISYRLRSRGFSLAHAARARARHHWRSTFAGYCLQQYGFGYGRLDVVARHPRHVSGDSVAPAFMMAHPIAMAAAVSCLVAAVLFRMTGAAPTATLVMAMAGAGIVMVLAAERTVAGIRATLRHGDPAALLFPAAHLLRDLCWVAAMAVWLLRRATAQAPRPAHSMFARPVAIGSHQSPPSPAPDGPQVPRRLLVIIPVHNEACAIEDVIADIRSRCPAFDILVVDDGSTDGTVEVLRRLSVRYLRLPERMGVGSAVRSGLRYGCRQGYDGAVRLDGDGQHAAEDVSRLIAPLEAGRADVVLGSRYIAAGDRRPSLVRATQVVLARCLSLVTRCAVTDPTSGFCGVGPRAMRLLAGHHPSGYGEAELRLLLKQCGLSVVEVGVGAHPRRAGQTSLTAGRLAGAGARVLLAMLVGSFASPVRGIDGD